MDKFYSNCSNFNIVVVLFLIFNIHYLYFKVFFYNSYFNFSSFRELWLRSQEV